MAASVEVVGAYTISASVGATTYLLGRGDNDDLFKLDADYSYQDVFTNESGVMPFESIRTGVKVVCSFSLIVIDRTVLSTFLVAIDGNASGGSTAPIPKVGSVLYNASGTAETCSIKVNYTSTLTVPRCRLVSYKQSDFGNRATRMSFHFEALPPVTSGAIDFTGNFYTIT